MRPFRHRVRSGRRHRLDLDALQGAAKTTKPVNLMTIAPPRPQPIAPAAPAAPGGDRERTLGLGSSTALVMGSIVGTGVSTVPAVLAGAGTSSILVLAVIAGGAILLGMMFGQLTRRVPNSDGGLYAYSRHEFGDFAGYLTAWCYWITAWAGNAAIGASWVPPRRRPPAPDARRGSVRGLMPSGRGRVGRPAGGIRHGRPASLVGDRVRCG